MTLKEVIKTLATSLKSSAMSHKKKLIFAALITLSGVIARKKLQPQHIVSIVMFFLKMSAQVVSYLPLPSFPTYRNLSPFSYQPPTPMP